jgi:RNA-directed DNA polymerase
LHELDSAVEQWTNEFNKGKERRTNPEYESVMGRVRRTRKKIRQLKEGKREAQYPNEQNDLLQKFQELRAKYLRIKSKDRYDPNYRRLLYCCSADDFMFGIIGSKEDANHIFMKAKTFLNRN